MKNLILFLFTIQVISQIPPKDKVKEVIQGTKNQYQLDDSFYFNKKIYFTAKSPEAQINSYFYLNTKTGATAYDIDVSKQLGKQYSNMDFLIKLDNDTNFMYSSHHKTNEKIASILLESPLNFLPQYLKDANAIDFFKDYFEETNTKTTVGNKGQYNATIFQGVNLDGGNIFTLFSNNIDFNLNPDNKLLILSYFGIGYIYYNGATKLITGWESDDFISRIEYIEDSNFTFNGKPYKTYQEKYDSEITKIAQNNKSSFEYEKQQLDVQEIKQNSKSNHKNPEITKLDNEIFAIKKLILDKKENLNQKTNAKAKVVSKKQGDLESINKSIYSTIGSKDILEIFKLESKVDELQGSKKLLSSNLKDKDIQSLQLEITCAKKKQALINSTIEKFDALDIKYGYNSQAGFLKKMELLNTNFTTALENICK